MINKIMNKYKIIYIIALLFSVYNINAEEIWTLEKCVQRAIKKNISIKNSQIDLKYANEDKIRAIGSFVPNFNLRANHYWNSGLTQNITTGLLEDQTMQYSTGDLSVQTEIYKGLTNFKQLHKANLVTLARKLQIEKITEDISLLIVNSYLQILFNKETLTVQESQFKIAKEELTIAIEKYENGIISKGDLYEIEANLATIEQNLIVAKNNYSLSKISLAQLILIDDINSFDIAYTDINIPKTNILTKNVKEIYSYALENKSEIKIAKTNLLISKKEKSIASSAMQPSVSGYYSFSSRIIMDSPISYQNQFDLNAGSTYGLQISIPILNNLNTKTNIQKSKLTILKNRNLLNQAKLDLENTIYQLLNDAEGSLKSYEASQKTFKARETAYNHAKERFKNGALNTLNFLQIKQKFEAAQAEIVKAKYDYIFKIKVLEFYFGVSL